MGEFIRFYSWGLSMKFHMAVYTLALVFFKAIFNALAGEGSVSSLTMLQMLLVSMAVAILESFLFPEGRSWSRPPCGCGPSGGGCCATWGLWAARWPWAGFPMCRFGEASSWCSSWSGACPPCGSASMWPCGGTPAP